MQDGTILSSQRYPSPHPDLNVFLVTYWSDGLRVKGFLVEPKEEGEYPGFLYLRGGIKGVGKVRIGRIVQFAAQGFVVFAPCYRGNMGGEGREDFALKDREDGHNGARLLFNHPKVNGEVNVFGFSRGGVMGLWTALEVPGIHKVVCWGGVTDVGLTYEERVDLRRMLKRVVGGGPNKYPERFEARTPLGKIGELRTPVCIIHGAKDQNVSVEHARLLEQKLREFDIPHTSWIYHDLDHYFPPQINRRTVQQLTDWLKQ
ncbi:MULTISPECIES: alpha/beta hydrolase family protein [Pontibacillus]|uniref:Prolyl oligopeptidase family serine peptidase n=1 Tax=Pontibacillus chungwhensis TaxID=265426 RepID=A0ABY8UXS4_9BACI|nr:MULTISPECIES: prolyl oligopeptidase family serine peptidase [Pontibacillus]MCD5325050.1 prolyl oligopeptidase family serine peptidase [Pontibacillus sp. HN14]WIF97304.1 prolyl oligopeptidase family serine peptidase [Pontibacillus chungwhensis]